MIGTPLPSLNAEQNLNPELQTPIETPEGELHLRFFVNSGTEYALPAIGIREVLEYSPDRINPMPNISPLLLGTINIRGRVIWVGDLSQFLGEQLQVNTDKAEISIIAIEDKGVVLGLAIDRISAMTWLEPAKLETKRTTDPINQFVKGQWLIQPPNSPDNLIEPAEPTVLKLLDHVSILQSSRWAA
ncbi:MAG: chemotaxis protein CheW [Pseudanabaenaceae cyanobacterium bins.68]|nr:chemotaxis protein CheW [Pseudanabaenaceae cyanobacterium bins.68]